MVMIVRHGTTDFRGVDREGSSVQINNRLNSPKKKSATIKSLKIALNVLQEKDALVVWKLDPLGRSAKDLVTIDMSTTASQFFFHVMASLAQMEQDLTVKRKAQA